MTITIEIPDEFISDLIDTFDPSKSRDKTISDRDFVTQNILGSLKGHLINNKMRALAAQAKSTVEDGFSKVANKEVSVETSVTEIK